MIGFIVAMIVTGGVVGGLARLALPGKDPMTFWETVAIGIAGSVLAGLLVRALSGGEYGPGLMGSVLASTGLVYAVRRVRSDRAGG